jgi:hypothetical protein
MRQGWDDLVGHLAHLVRSLGLWRDMGFASFGHYCAERLGMAESTVSQRAWLERRMQALPAVRAALRDGRLSYEKARLVAGSVDVAGSFTEEEVDAAIARAERTTCIALRRELEDREEGQMCARSEVLVRVPVRVAALFDAAIRAARDAAGRWISPGEALARIAAHFVETWEGAVKRRTTRSRRVLARDRGWCQVPGCSRAATQAHHVEPRARGGGDEPENQVALCAAHHLHGVHRGYLRVRGQAPGALAWELGDG